MTVLIFSSTLTRHFCFKGNEETQMYSPFMVRLLTLLFLLQKVAHVRTSSTTIDSLGPLKLRLITMILPYVYGYDHPGECSPEKDCVR